jgi:hypothetical protein
MVTMFGLCAVKLEIELLRLPDLARKKFGMGGQMNDSSHCDMI